MRLALAIYSNSRLSDLLRSYRPHPVSASQNSLWRSSLHKIIHLLYAEYRYLSSYPRSFGAIFSALSIICPDCLIGDFKEVETSRWYFFVLHNVSDIMTEELSAGVGIMNIFCATIIGELLAFSQSLNSYLLFLKSHI